MSVGAREATAGSGARPLKVGLILPVQDDGMAGATPRWADLRAMAERAEQVGFDSLWLADHLLFKRGEIQIDIDAPGADEIDLERERVIGAWEVWSLLGALAAVTKRVALGPLVACAGYRNPALLAKMADTLDELSGGRLILGLGAGDSGFEHRAFGYPYDHKVGRFEEALTIIRALLREGSCDFAGTYYQARECELRPRGPRPHGPPLLLGALAAGRRMLRLTAQYADLWNGWLVFGRNYADVVPPLRQAVDEACRRHGRDPATLGRTASVRVAMLGELPPFGEPIQGGPEEVAAALRAFAGEGVSHVQVWLTPNTLGAVEAFAPVLELLDRG